VEAEVQARPTRRRSSADKVGGVGRLSSGLEVVGAKADLDPTVGMWLATDDNREAMLIVCLDHCSDLHWLYI
jgi:hypothetical protein